MIQINDLPDLERMFMQIYKYPLLINAHKEVVNFEEISTKKLKES
jgi:hypothetical protein